MAFAVGRRGHKILNLSFRSIDTAYVLCQVQVVLHVTGDLCCWLLTKRVRVLAVMVRVAQNGNCWQTSRHSTSARDLPTGYVSCTAS